MKAVIDVHYSKDRSIAACVVFKQWQDSIPFDFKRIILPPAEDYYPGQFYRRELPCLLSVLEKTGYLLETIIIDGYVHLKKGKGLGMYLFESLPYVSNIIGVAKNPLKIAHQFTPIMRGKSRRPLFISSIGCSIEYAVNSIVSMHGDFRIPTLLKIADALTRGEAHIY
ncbi:MAG: endonuclease V [Syntrophorhabdaceae bacterium]|nr:endonuclease V [Syntrophorhabdaceae bacterium]